MLNDAKAFPLSATTKNITICVYKPMQICCWGSEKLNLDVGSYESWCSSWTHWSSQIQDSIHPRIWSYNKETPRKVLIKIPHCSSCFFPQFVVLTLSAGWFPSFHFVYICFSVISGEKTSDNTSSLEMVGCIFLLLCCTIISKLLVYLQNNKEVSAMFFLVCNMQ